jgi:flagellin
MAKEAARLQALQIKQQLAIMALGIANSAPSMLLQLFQRR